MYSVYLLRDPRDNLVYYVGISKDVQQRFMLHLRDRMNAKKAAWIAALQVDGLLPLLEIVESALTCKEAQDHERYLIYTYHKDGMPLTNKDGIQRKSTNRGMTGSGNRKRPPSTLVINKVHFEQFFTLKEVAEITQIPEGLVRSHVQKKKLKVIAFSPRNLRVSETDLRDYIEKQVKPDKK